MVSEMIYLRIDNCSCSFSDNFIFCLSLLDQGHSFDVTIYVIITLSFHYLPFMVVHHIISFHYMSFVVVTYIISSAYSMTKTPFHDDCEELDFGCNFFVCNKSYFFM
jgi:hypothetical protein